MSAAWTDKTSRWQIVIWSAIMALAIFLSLRHYDAFQVGVYGDDAAYVVLARSLASHRGFGLIHTPAPEPLPSPFPPGYPLLLAPLVAWLPDNLEILKIPSLLATLANGALLFWGWHWFSRRSRWWGLAVASLYLLFPTVIDHSRMVMSEAIFTTLGLVGLMLTEQISQRRPIAWRAPLLGAVLTYALFARSVGLVFALSMPAYLLWRRRRDSWRPIAWASVAGLCLTGLVLSLTPVALGDLIPVRYLTEDSNSLHLLAREAGTRAAVPEPIQQPQRSTLLRVRKYVWRHLTTELRQTVLPIGGGEMEKQLAARLRIPWLTLALSLVVLALVVVGGLAWWIKEGPSAFAVGAMAYFAAALSRDWIGPRLLYPVLPPLLLCLLSGIGAISRTASATARRWLPDVWITRHLPPRGCMSRAATVSAALLLGCLATLASYRLTDSRLHVGDLSARTDWLRANTPASAVVMSEQPWTDFLYSGRHTVPQATTAKSAADLYGLVVESGADYVLLAPKVEWQRVYDPVYSEQTSLLLPWLAELQSTAYLAEVYSDTSNGLVVLQRGSH